MKILGLIQRWWKREEKQSVIVESDDYVISLHATDVDIDVTEFRPGFSTATLHLTANDVHIMEKEDF